jgi:hypothetical protein
MNRAVCNVLTNDAALHYKYDAANSCDVFQRITIEGNDVGLQAPGAMEPIWKGGSYVTEIRNINLGSCDRFVLRR